MDIDPKILSLIIQKEIARKNERAVEYEQPALYQEIYEDSYEEPESDASTRGVTTIDI